MRRLLLGIQTTGIALNVFGFVATEHDDIRVIALLLICGLLALMWVTTKVYEQ